MCPVPLAVPGPQPPHRRVGPGDRRRRGQSALRLTDNGPRGRLLHLPVGAVPGPVTSMASAGCHALVRETDAVLVTDAGEVAELAGHIGEDLAPEPERAARAPEDDLDTTSYGVWSAVPLRGGISTDRLVSAAGVPAGRLVGILAGLEADGLVERHDGRWRKVAASRRDEGLLGELGRGP